MTITFRPKGDEATCGWGNYTVRKCTIWPFTKYYQDE